MLTVGDATSETGDAVSDDATKRPPTDPKGRRDRSLRWAAAALGLLGTLLAFVVPLMPVAYDVVDLRWPTVYGTGAVSAPLLGYQPLSVRADVPCAAIRDLAARKAGSAVLFATTPPSSMYGDASGMSLRLKANQVVVFAGGQQLATAALPAGDCGVSVRSDGASTVVRLGGATIVDLQQNARPQVTGIYSDLDGNRDDIRGLSVDVRVDTRYETTATAAKLAVIALAIAAFAGCVVMLRQLDVRATGRVIRLVPTAWWRPTGRDAAVITVLLIWWLFGAVTSDDGYILTMAEDQARSGYIGNIYRWFDTPEAPFGWFYELYALWVRVSTATPWVRLPALLMGVCSWLLISREVMPRLGPAVRRSRAAGWAAAVVFLSFWLPYDNGLRPEPVVVIWALLGMCAVERAVATKRLLPLALGLFAASFALAATPTGLIVLAPFLAAARPLSRLLRARIREFGWLPTLAPLVASGTVVLGAVFANQTLRSVWDSTVIRTGIGPAEAWYQEMDRYQALFTMTPDGSLARRFPVLLVFLCLGTCLVVLLRRGSIPGAALGPSRRLIGTTVLSIALLALTPTKWTHHFGAFAALGGSLAALTALATSASVLRSQRNRALFTAGLLIIAALAATGPNAWWYVSGWGSPWFDKAPSFHGHMLSTVLLAMAVIALVIAGVEHLRLVEPGAVASDARTAKYQRRQSLLRLTTRSQALRLASTPLAVVCAVLVLAEVATMGKAIQKQWHSYSLGKDDIAQLTGASCGLSDYVYVEKDPLAGVLVPVPGANNQATMTGFHRDGLPASTGSDAAQPDWTALYQAAGDRAPVWGDYDPSGATVPGELRTPWYTLPDRARTGDSPLVVDLAGQESGTNSVTVEFGTRTAHGFDVIDRRRIVKPGGPTWREARLTLGGAATRATAVRLVVTSRAVGVDQWLAVSTPRVPTLVRMTDLIGTSPVFMEWPTTLVHPCLRQFDTRDGIGEVPAYRVSAGTDLRDVGQGWSAPGAGGPFGWLNVVATERTLPTYLKGDLDRDWGTLYAIDPYVSAVPTAAAERIGHEVHSGLYSPGPVSEPIELPGSPAKSDTRTGPGGGGAAQ